MIQLDFNIIFMGGGGVFVVVSVFKNFILRLDMAMCFFNIFVQDCNTRL